MPCVAIEDGYTVPFYIAAVDGIHGDLSGEFRPAMGKTADPITTLCYGDKENLTKFWEQSSKILAKQVASWDLMDRQGVVKPISEANMLAVPQDAYHKLWLVVAGQRASDPRPDGMTSPASSLESDAKN